MRYIGFATGRVVHIRSDNPIYNSGWDDEERTLCGKRFNPGSPSSNGLDIYNGLPGFISLCRKCAKAISHD